MTIIEVPDGYRWKITCRQDGGRHRKGSYVPLDTAYYLSYQEKFSRETVFYIKKHWWSLWKTEETIMYHNPRNDWMTLETVRLPDIFNEEIIRETAMGILYSLAENEPALAQAALHDSFVGTYPPKTLN